MARLTRVRRAWAWSAALTCIEAVACSRSPDAGDSNADRLTDRDGDGHGSVETGGDDCDDDDPDVHPEAPEDCHDRLDSNCDGVVEYCKLSRADAIMFSSGGYTGLAVDMAPDLDGDGLAEVMVASMMAYDVNGIVGGVHIASSGRLNRGGPVNLDDSYCVFDNEPIYDWDQSTAEFVPDVDGEGVEDLLIGGGDYGEAYLLLGEDLPCPGEVDFGSAYAIFNGSGSFGHVVNGGDVDGDGHGDLMVGKSDAGGWLYLYDGAGVDIGEYNAVTSARVTVEGDSSQRLTGCGIETGDLDADGWSDIIVGDASDRGMVYVLHGSGLPDSGTVSVDDVDASFSGEGEPDGASFVHYLDDVDGDGFGDFLVLAPGHDWGTGAAYLWYGSGSARWSSESESNADVEFFGTEVEDRKGPRYGDGAVGYEAGAVGDLDADGRTDLVVYGGIVDGVGLVNFFHGASIPASGRVDVGDADLRFAGEFEKYPNYVPMYGAVAGGEDIDGDGIDDFVVSDITDRSGYKSLPAGSAYLLYGW